MTALRHTILVRLRRRLEQQGYPRLQMAILVALTGGAGFICSFTLLTHGMHAMGLRYLLSVGAAYLVFLGLLWLWMRISAPSYVDPRDLMRLDQHEPVSDDEWREHKFSDDGPSFWDLLDVELTLPLVVLGFFTAVLAASFYIVYAAPVLFAELMLDGVLAVTLYHRLRTIDIRPWLETAIWHTFVTFLVAGVVLALAGFAMSHYVPEAKSVGEVLQRVMH